MWQNGIYCKYIYICLKLNGLDAGKHITGCRAFSVMNGSGSILAGEHKTFTFRFKSDVPGVFLESWVIRIAPRLPRQWTLDPIFLKGVAFSEDKLQYAKKPAFIPVQKKSNIYIFIEHTTPSLFKLDLIERLDSYWEFEIEILYSII